MFIKICGITSADAVSAATPLVSCSHQVRGK